MPILSLVLALPAAAEMSSKVRLAGGLKAEEKLRRFVERDARFKARIQDAARREEAFLAESRESTLRDSVSDFSGERLRAGIETARGEERKRALEILPGMKPPSDAPVCFDLPGCVTPDLAMEAPDAERLPDAVRRLVRPWMLLQAERGSELELSSVEGPGDAALTMRLKDLDAAPLVINVTPRLLGGFKVWLDRPLVLAALYSREREAALRR